MSEWDDLKQRIEEMNKLVIDLMPVEDQSLAERLGRLRHVGTLTEQVVEEVDEAGVRQDWFEGLSGYVTNVVSELESFVADENVGHLENAANSWPNIVSALSPLAILVHPPSKNRITREANAFRQTVTKLADEVQQQAQGVREELDGLTVRIEEDEVLRSQAAQVFTDRQSEVDARVNEAAARLDQALDEHRQAFTAEQTERGEAAQAERDARKQDSEKQIAEQTGAFETHLDQLKQMRSRAEAEAGKQKERLDQLLDQATKVYNTIGGVALAGGYSEEAVEQRKVADRWRWGAIAALAGSVAVAAAAFITSQGDDVFNWQRFLAKLAVAATLGALAGYAGSQAAHHRDREVKAKRTQLILNAIDPYLALMPTNDRDAIKKQVALVLFGADELVEPPGTEHGSSE
jgi:hypothetical protein